MGTLNISSMDLRAVNVPVRRSAQAQAKPKRPKYRSPGISKTRKCMLVFSAAGLIVAAFILPPAQDGKQIRTISTASGAESISPENLQISEPQRLLSSDVAASKIKQEGVQSRKRQLEPLSQALPFAPSTVADVSIALNVLSGYIQNGSTEQKQEARLRIGEFRREHLHTALCDQIRNNETPALAVIAELVIQHKPEGAVEALIERLNSKQRKVYAHSELIRALCQFSNEPKASAELTTMLVQPNITDRDLTWAQLGSQMPPQFVNLALERVIKEEPDAKGAAQALARYGATLQTAMQIGAEVDKAMVTAPQSTRVRLVEMLSGLEPNATASRLRLLTSDPNEGVRAAAFKALAGNPDNAEFVLNAIQNDSGNRVKIACIEGLGAHPNPAILNELIGLLTNNSLRHYAKRALVSANNGNDLGWQDLEWRAWLEIAKAHQ